MSKTLELVGKKFGKLMVVKYSHTNKHGSAIWTCKCNCGKICQVSTNSLKSNHTKSCGCNLKFRNVKHGKLRNILCKKYREYFSNSKIRNLEFAISYRYFMKLIQSPCHYCGFLPDEYNGVDRKDNSIGYTIENSVSCCTICNRGKNNLSYIEFINYINRIRRKTDE